MKSEGRSISAETVLSYIKECTDAFLFYQVKRQNLQGRKILTVNEKYYVADHGIREAVFGGGMKEFRLNSIFVRFFLYIMALVLLSIGLVSFFSYRKSSGMMISEVQNSNMLVLKQAQKGIDQEIKSLQSNIMQAAINRSLNEVVYLAEQKNYDDFALIRDSIAYLSTLKSNSSHITDIWLYIKKADIILGTEGKYQRPLFFSEVCKYTEEITWDKIFTEGGFNYIGSQSIERGTHRIPVIVFTESMPLIDESPKGMLVVNMNKSLFEEEMSNYSQEKVVFNYVLDGKDNIVYTNESYYTDFEDYDLIQPVVQGHLEEMKDDQDTIELTEEGRPFTVQYVQSKTLDWKYISVIPTGYIKKSVDQIRDVTVLVAILSLFLSVILTLYIINSLYKPVNKILSYINLIKDKKTVMGQRENGNEFTLINSIIDYVYKENQTLQDNFEKNRPMLQDKFIHDILNGQVSNDWENIGFDIGVEFPFPYFQVIVYKIDEEISSSLKKYKKSNKQYINLMQEIADSTLEGQCKYYFLDKDEQTIVSLLNTPDSFYEFGGINDYLEKVQNLFGNEGNLMYVIGIGQSYKDIHNSYQSFIDALETAKYQIVKGQNAVIYFDEVKNSKSENITYSLESETQLIMITKSGNRGDVAKILENVFSINFSEKKLSPEMVDNLFHALAGTAVRVIFEMRLTSEQIFPDRQDLYKELDRKKNIEEKKEYVSETFDKIARYAAENKQGQQGYILAKINDYLEENYKNEVSLDTVAEVVNLSKSYLSFIFKENSGLNFVDYVNQFRLEKAKELLRSSSRNISEIAELVGYSSANSFSKVFKKYNGISPGQYRKL